MITREEMRNKIIHYLKAQVNNPELQIDDLDRHFREDFQGSTDVEQRLAYSIIREIIQGFVNNGLLYFGQPMNSQQGYPLITVTEYGKQCLESDNWLPYDPDGYINDLRNKSLNIDEITIAYISEATHS